MLGAVAVTYLLFQSLLLPFENALRSLLPEGEVPVRAESNLLAVHSVAKSVIVRNPLTVHMSEFNDSMSVGVAKNEDVGGAIGDGGRSKGKDNDAERGFELVVYRNLNTGSPSENVVHMKESLESVRNKGNSSFDEASEGRHSIPQEEILKLSDGVSMEKNPEENMRFKTEKSNGVDTTTQSPHLELPKKTSSITLTHLENVMSNATSSAGSSALQSDMVTLKNDSVMLTISGKKKMRCNMPPKSITYLHEMNSILVRHRASSRSMVQIFVISK